MCNVRFLICLFKVLSITLSQLITATILFLQFVLWQLKTEQFSPGILRFKHEDNPLTLNRSKVLRTFLFIFHAGLHRLGSKNFRNSSYKEKTVSSARVSRLSFCFLWLWWDIYIKNVKKCLEKIWLFVKRHENFNLNPEACLRPCQTSMIKFFCKNNYRLLWNNHPRIVCFPKKPAW